MSIVCIKPLEIEFTAGIEIDCSMKLNYDSNNPNTNFGISVNADNLYLSIKQEEEVLKDPIILDKDCAKDGKLKIDKVMLNKLYLNGVIDFVIDASLTKNSDNVDSQYGLAWRDTKQQICIEDDTLLAYPNSINDKYKVKVTVKNVHLHEVDHINNDLDIFYFAGSFLIEPVLI